MIWGNLNWMSAKITSRQGKPAATSKMRGPCGGILSVAKQPRVVPFYTQRSLTSFTHYPYGGAFGPYNKGCKRGVLGGKAALLPAPP